VSRAARWFFAPAPAERLAVVRIVVCGYALAWAVVRTPTWLDLARLPEVRHRPVGVLTLLDGPVTPLAVGVLAAGTVLAGAAAVVGWRWMFSGPAFAAGFLVLASHGASWGQILHTEHLPALHLLVLAASPAAGDALAVGSRRAPGPAADRYGWPLRALALVTVTTYVVAGVAKLRYGGPEWVSGEVLRNLVAHDNLRKQLMGDPSSPVARYVVGHPSLFAPAAVLTVVVELGAPLALVGGRLRTLWVATAWAFHVGVLVMMAVLFLYPLLGVAFVALFRAERLADAVRGRWPGRRPAAASWGEPPG
jgi:hypothetical protein